MNRVSRGAPVTGQPAFSRTRQASASLRFANAQVAAFTAQMSAARSTTE